MEQQFCVKDFIRYTVLSVLGTLGVSCYILAHSGHDRGVQNLLPRFCLTVQILLLDFSGKPFQFFGSFRHPSGDPFIYPAEQRPGDRSGSIGKDRRSTSVDVAGIFDIFMKHPRKAGAIKQQIEITVLIKMPEEAGRKILPRHCIEILFPRIQQDLHMLPQHIVLIGKISIE